MKNTDYPKHIALSPEDAKKFDQKYGHPDMDTPYVGDDYVLYKLVEVKDD